MQIYRVVRGGVEVPGERVGVKEGALVEVRVLRGREFYDVRAGCEFPLGEVE